MIIRAVSQHKEYNNDRSDNDASGDNNNFDDNNDNRKDK